MIGTVIQISLRRLMHNRIELLLTFVVPIAFFSVFALIFGKGVGSGSTPKVKVVIVDEADSQASAAIVQRLGENPGLRVLSLAQEGKVLTADKASRLVRRGNVSIGIVLEAGPGRTLRSRLLADASDQVAPQVVSALVARELAIARVRSASPAVISVGYSGNESTPRATDETELVKIVDVMGENKSNPVASMYAAGIAVMFLLFGAAGGGGVLLEERENTTLDRLLSTQMTMDQLLLGKWFYLSALGFVQVCIMFIWGQLVFGIDLIGHLDGFVMMTVVTSSAAAAFGIFLATLCRTRGQLNGLSVILILTMSALGGSMVPRYVMSEEMRSLGQWTFNAWALDGYDKVFWRDLPVNALSPQLGVLMAAGIGFLLVARALAIRWEFD